MSIDYDLNGRLKRVGDNAVVALPVWRQSPEWLCSLTVSEEDCDVLGHANNVRYVRWLEAMAWQHSASLGLDWLAYQRFNRAMVARHHDIHYLRATTPGQVLWLATWRQFCDQKLRFTRGYQIVTADMLKPMVVLNGETEWVSVRVDNGRPARMPTEFAEAYSPLSAGVE